MKRRVLKSILCSLLIVALLTAPMSALAASKKVYILKVSVSGSTGSLVRSKQGGEVIGSLRNGTKVLYWGEKSGQMLKIMASNGRTGYVYQGNLKNYGALNRKQFYVTKNAAKLYKRSGSSLKKAGSIKKGVPVFVYTTNNGWAYIRNMSGAAAYIKTSDLTKV